MDDTKEIGAIGADTLDISSIPSLSISDLDSMLTTSITGASDTLTMIDPHTLGNVTISSGSVGATYTLGSGTASNAIWTTGTCTLRTIQARSRSEVRKQILTSMAKVCYNGWRKLKNDSTS